jgi:hypothetical protein
VGRELGPRQLPGQDVDDQPLDIIGIDAGERPRTLLAVTQQRAADIVAITIASAQRVAGGHDVAAVIVKETCEKGASLHARLPSYRAIVCKPGLDGDPQFFIDDCLVLTGIDDALMKDFAPVDTILQEVIERAAVK